jgi:hypothetical protein
MNCYSQDTYEANLNPKFKITAAELELDLKGAIPSKKMQSIVGPNRSSYGPVPLFLIAFARQ